MPTPKKGEKRSDYMKRCVPFVMDEDGIDNDAAVGKCEGMFDQHKKKSKASTHPMVMEFIHEHQWAILPGHLESMIAIANGEGNIAAALQASKDYEDQKVQVRKLFAGVDFNQATGQGKLPPNQVTKATAVIDVLGPIFPRANAFQKISGAASVDSIKSQFIEAMEDPEVDRIVMHFDSPGGEITGIDDLSQMIYESRGKGKEIVAYTSGMCASAAYWIGSACESMIMSSTALAGSIGVIVQIPDDREAKKKAGVKRHDIVSSVSPNKNPDAATDEGRAQLQAMVDDVAKLFVDRVAKNRGVTSKEVINRFGGGDMYIADKAVKKGMADGVGTYHQVIEKVVQKPGPLYTPENKTKGESNMLTAEEEKQLAALQAKTMKDEDPPGKPATKKSKAMEEDDEPDDDDDDPEEKGEGESKKKKKAKAEEPKNNRDGKDGEKDKGDRAKEYKEAGKASAIATLKGLDEMRIPHGMEKFHARHKYDEGMTVDKMKALMLDQQEAKAEGRMDDIESDASDLGKQSSKAGNALPGISGNVLDGLVKIAADAKTTAHFGNGEKKFAWERK